MMMSEGLAFAAGVAVKASIPLLIGATIVFLLMRRRAAAERHLVWTVAVIGALVVPALSLAVPAWDVSLAVPEWLAVSRDVPGDVSPSSDAPSTTVNAALRAGSSSSDASHSSDVTSSGFDDTSREASASGAASLASADGGVAVAAIPVRPAPKLVRARSVSPTALVLAVWLFGALCVIARVLVGFVRLGGVVRDAVPLRDPALTVRARAIATDLGIDRPVRLIEGAHDAMPMTFGVLRASLLLPSSAKTWTHARQDAVLRHELAHVRRYDTLTQLIAEIGCALYWFNPLMWVAAHRLCVEREYACDDAVILAGSRASDYAAELLDIARTMQAQRATTLAAIAMARPSQLRTRLTAVLEHRRRSHRVGVRLLVPAWVAAAAVVIPVSSSRLVARPAPDAGTLPPAARTWAAPKTPVVVSTSHAAPDPVVAANTALAGTFSVSAPFPEAQEDCLSSAGGKSNTSINTNSNDERRTIKWSGARCSGEAIIEGEVEFDAAFTTIAGLSRDGYVRITMEENRIERRVVIRPGAGGLTFEYTVDGDRRTFDDAGRQWLSNTLTFMFRRVGFMAKERATAMLARGGPNAVLTEVAVLQGDYVRSAYLTVLIADGKLNEPTLRRVLDLAGRTIDSDHYKTSIVTAVAGKYAFTDGIRAAYLQAVSGLDSDHYRHQAYATLLTKGNLPSDQVSAVLRESKRIGSDHYRASLLTDMAERYQMTPEIRAAYLEASADLDSDHYKAQVLQNLIKQGALNGAQLARVIDAAATVDGDHYRANVLTSLVGSSRLADNATVHASFNRAAGGLGDHYLQALASNMIAKNADAATLNTALDLAAKIESDHYRAALLTEIARRYKLEGASRDKFITLMDAMSSHYKGNVASVLLKSAR